jgi:hypothetical protein
MLTALPGYFRISLPCAVAHPATHENVILVLCSFRDRRRNRYRNRNRPFGIDIIDSDADTDSDPEVSRFLPLFSEQPLMPLWRTR